MKLPLYKYTCHCGNVFKVPKIPGEFYGDFLLRSEIDELVYFNAINSREFDELSEILDLYFQLKDRKDLDGREVVQDLFSLVCDLSPQKKLYFMNKFPNCPQCLSPYQMKSWIDVYPPEIIDVDIKEVSFNEWNKLGKREKIELIEKGFETASKKSQECVQDRRSSPSWPSLSSAEKKEVTARSDLLQTKNFKIMLSSFRKIRGLDASSPIDDISLNQKHGIQN